MIKVRDYEIKSSIDELTVGQFEVVSGIMNDMGLGKVDKYVQIFEFLGLPESIWDDMETKEFTKLVSDYNEPYGKEMDYQPTIEIDGYTYRAFTDEFSVTIKDMKFIEAAVKADPKKWVAESLAVIFKREDLSKTEHYDTAHLKHKAKLFKEIKAVIAIPYIQYIGKELNTALESKIDESTESVE
jgi:hypothetical protein